MTLTVSIVAYHTPREELVYCIDNLLGYQFLDRIDIIDNSRDESIEAVIAGYPSSKVKYIPNDNIGYGAANNLSIRGSVERGVDYHLVMNSDIQFDNDVIPKLLEIMEKDEAIGLTIPQVIGLDGFEQSSYHPLPTPLDLLLHRFVPRSWVKRRMDRYELKVAGRTRPLRVPYVHGCFMLMRVSALKDVGFFDERFFMYPEDIDLTRRINKDYKALVIPWLRIVHAHRAESKRSFKMLWIHIVNMIKYFNKWGWFSTRKNTQNGDSRGNRTF